jgi:hypothetical protein
VSEQTAIELPEQPKLPDLPEPPAYWPTTVSKYTRIRMKGNFHCHVCVRLRHDYGWNGTPRRAQWRRRGLPTDGAKDQLDLCQDHYRQYLNRDNDARTKAHVKPLPGGG